MKYRKKPVVVEAVQFNDPFEVVNWVSSLDISTDQRFEINGTSIKIPTLEGIMKAQKGDYIICGVKGEFYPCKPDIFEQTYEAVD